MADSLEEHNLVVFYYLCASEICPDKRVGLWWERLFKRVTTVYTYLNYIFFFRPQTKTIALQIKMYFTA